MRVFRGRAVTATTAPAERRTADTTTGDGRRHSVGSEPAARRRSPLRPRLRAAA